VLWTSVGAGKRTQRTGRIVEIVKPGRRPRTRGLADPGLARTSESYVVRCGETRRHYWPRYVARLDEVGIDDLIEEGSERDE